MEKSVYVCLHATVVDVPVCRTLEILICIYSDITSLLLQLLLSDHAGPFKGYNKSPDPL